MPWRDYYRGWSTRRKAAVSIWVVVALIAGVGLVTSRWGGEPGITSTAVVPPTNQWGYQAFSEPNGWHQGAEAALGQTFEASSVYISMIHPESFPQEGQHIVDVGGQMYLHLSSQYDSGGTKVAIDYADIRAGLYDVYLHQWATEIIALGLPRKRLLITWQHEPTANNAQQPKTGDWSGPAYVLTFAYVKTLLVADGVIARWGYFPVVSAYGSQAALNYYPGDTVVDVIGADAYQRIDSKSSFLNKVQRFLDFAQLHGKPAAVGELGNSELDGTRPQWFTDVAAFLFGKVIFVNWNAKPEFGLVDPSPEWDAWVAASVPWYAVASPSPSPTTPSPTPTVTTPPP